jgi:uncharacterized tellurite resistance protein B-like protein
VAEERNWSTLNCLCYLYNAFAVYTDGDLDNAEKDEIRNIVGEWVPDLSRNEVHSALDLCLGYFKEDLTLDLADDDSRVVVSTCIAIASIMKDNMSEGNCKAIHSDLIRIGMADGHYDETEKAWATALGQTLGVVSD